MDHHEADGSVSDRLRPGAGKGAVAAETDDRLDAEILKRGRWLFAQECSFTAGSDRIATLPEGHLPEVAFAGRSNVGKSSLINALVGRKALARVSRTPGRTQAVNLFDLGGRIVLADLPGYGYAKVAKHRIEAWSELIPAYLRGRPGLARVFLLIDSRMGLKDTDREAMRLLDRAAVSYQVTLTKCDHLSATALTDAIARVSSDLADRPAAHPAVVATSADSGAGIDELRARIATLAVWPSTSD